MPLTHDEIECPYCGQKLSDSWEYCNEAGREQKIKCWNKGCEKTFILNIDFTTNYWTSKPT